MKILLFAGTSEGRVLARRLAELPVEATVAVATEYGREVLGELPEQANVLVGRLDAEGIVRLIQEHGHNLIIDATHPYAEIATGNIRAAAERTGVPLLRLAREKGGDGAFSVVSSAAEAARLIAGMSGNVLLATGTKELAAFAVVPDFARRCFPRVLPTLEAIRECERLGFPGSHVIAMQGPFTREMNIATLRQFGIDVMVTKDGGAAGGFPEKTQAAEEVGARVIVIGRPESDSDSGMGLEDVLRNVLLRLKRTAMEGAE